VRPQCVPFLWNASVVVLRGERSKSQNGTNKRTVK
jgi:hypothetical protein